MKKILALVALALLALPTLASAADAATGGPAASSTLAQTTVQAYDSGLGRGIGILGAAVGAGIVIVGAGRGIGSIGGHAVESIARQPEAGPRIFTTMIISAALIEGATLFGLVICFLVGNKL